MFCKKCGNKLPDGASFCNKCGNKIEKKEEKINVAFCSKCGNKLVDGASFCNKCGNKIKHHEEHKKEEKKEIKQEVKNETKSVVENKVNQQPTQSKPKNKDTNKILIGAIVGVIVLIFIVSSFGNTKGISLSSKGGRTIMIYMVGSNLESKSGLGSRDLQDLDYNKISANNARVVLMAGGTQGWRNNYISQDETSIYELKENGFVKVDARPLDNMGAAENLYYFLNYVGENYKADKYNFIFWDHGGAIDGSEYDDLARDNLKLTEMKKAFDKSIFKGNNKLDTISFRTCLNGTIEVANLYKEHAKYLVASEEVTIGSQADSAVRFINDILPSDDGEKYGKKQIDTYKEVVTNTCNYSTGNKSGENYCVNSTYSIVDLSKIDNVNSKLQKFAKSVKPTISKNYQTMSRLRANMGQYAASSNDYTYDMIDLYDLALKYRSYSTADADNLMKAVDEAVVYNWTNNNYSHGISVYFPYNYNYFLETYKDITTSNEYTDFITSFYAMKTSSTTSSYSNFSSTKGSVTMNNDEEADFQIELSDEQADNFAKAQYIVFVDTKDGYYQLLYSGNDVKLKGNTLTAKVQGKQLRITDIEYDDQSLWLTLTEDEVTDKYTDLHTSVILQNSLWDMQVATLKIRIDDKHPNGYIKALYTENNNSKKDFNTFAKTGNTGLKLTDYYLLVYGSQRYKLLDENGNYNPNWYNDNNGIYQGYEYLIDEFKFVKEDFSSDYDYYALFKIWDTSNNSYFSDVIKMKG